MLMFPRNSYTPDTPTHTHAHTRSRSRSHSHAPRGTKRLDYLITSQEGIGSEESRQEELPCCLSREKRRVHCPPYCHCVLLLLLVLLPSPNNSGSTYQGIGSGFPPPSAHASRPGTPSRRHVIVVRVSVFFFLLLFVLVFFFLRSVYFPSFLLYFFSNGLSPSTLFPLPSFPLFFFFVFFFIPFLYITLFCFQPFVF